MLREYICWEETNYNHKKESTETKYHLHVLARSIRSLEEIPINSPQESFTCTSLQDIALFLKKQRPRDRNERLGKIVLYSGREGCDLFKAPKLSWENNDVITVSGGLHETEQLSYLLTAIQHACFG